MLWAALWPLILMFAIGIPICWFLLPIVVDWFWYSVLNAERIGIILELYKQKEKERWRDNALKEDNANPRGSSR